MIEWLYVFLGILPILYLCLTWNYSYWKKRGIPQLDPLPGVGNLLDAVLNKQCPCHIYTDFYNEFPDAPVVGFYKLTTPALLVKDPELVQQVMVRDFSSFHDNFVYSSEKVDPYMYRDPFISKGADWKTHRSALVPGLNLSKMKSIFPQMKEVTKHLENYLDNNLNKHVKVKDLAFMFTTDIISNCAFGINGNSFAGTEEVFKTLGQLMVKEFDSLYKMNIMLVLPKLSEFLGHTFIPKAVGNYLKSAIVQNDEYRRKNNIERNDFMQYILSLYGKKKNSEKNEVYSDFDVVGYAMTVFSEGFETSAITASFAIYELALNPDIQENLRSEILSTVSKVEDLDYDKLHGMTYLDKVISETLRKFPVIFIMTRVCTKNTTLNINGKPLAIEKGTPIVISAYGLQNDPKFFPNPDKFDPERFSPENIASRPQYSYVPFGEGPRICIGMRLGLTQVKLFVATIVLKYNILSTDKTPKKVIFNKKSLLANSEEELLVTFEKRQF